MLFSSRMLALAALLVLTAGTVVWLPVTEANHLQCSDGTDNDNDGKTDFPADPDCSSSDDTTEAGTATAASSSMSSASSSASSVDGLSISITDDRNSIRPDDSMIYAITLRQNTQAERTVNVDLALPAQAQLITPDQGGTVTNGTHVRWNGLRLPQNQSVRLTVLVGVAGNAPEGLQFIARATADNASASDTTVIQSSPSSSAPFTVSLTDNRTTAAPNEVVTYVLNVTNTAGISQNSDVVLTLPQFLTADVIEPSTTYDSNVLTWKSVSFDAGQTRTFTVRGTVNRSAPQFASMSAQAKVGAATASDTTSIQTAARTASSVSSSRSSVASSTTSSPSTRRSVFFSKSADTEEITPGGTVRYTIYVQNVLLQTIDDAIVSDKFDAALLTPLDNGGGTVTMPGELQWHVPTLLPGQVWRQSYTLAVSPTAANGTILNNVATIVGSDVSTVSLDEKVTVVRTGVVNRLPSTGAAMDVLFVLLSIPAAAATTYMQRRRV